MAVVEEEASWSFGEVAVGGLVIQRLHGVDLAAELAAADHL